MSSESMRITHVIRAKPPGEMGGADLHVADLAGCQLSKGHQVLVVCLGSAEVISVLRQRGVPCVELASMSMLRWAGFLTRELRHHPPDILHTHGYRADIISLLATYALLPRGRWTTVMTVHGFIRATLGTRVLTWANERGLRFADVVIATSQAEANRLRTLLHRPVQYVANGIFPVRLVTRQEAKARLGIATSRCVAFTGRLSAEKRPDLFLGMAELLMGRDNETAFVLIGSGPMAGQLSRRLPTHLRGRVVFAGLLPNAASLLSGIDVLVCPSDTEGTPRVIIEAMLAGVPVVGTKVGGIPNLITNQQTGLLVEPGSPGALADAVCTLLDSPDLARAIGERAKSAAQFLTSDRMEEQTAQAYLSGALSPFIGTKAS
jgi:glycosyltransferase involved in cell wall biosynthesis